MNNFGIVLKALFRNKLRFDESATKNKKIGLIVLFAVAYALILSFVIFMTVTMGAVFAANGLANTFYFLLLLTASGIVLIFGIITLISTLYLSKDTDFYSMLPIKSSVVFAAKLVYVYLFEAALVAAIILPSMIAFGIVIRAWAWYYVITILALAIIPALPLFVAAIFAVPIMYLAGKLKNRSIVPLIFYTVMFLGFFGLYIWFVMTVSSLNGSVNISPDDVAKVARVMTVIGYIMYPFTCVSSAAFGLDTFGLGVGASTAVNLIIFVSISAVLTVAIMLLGRFMYAQSVKANNQTDNSVVKRGEFKAAGTIKSLIVREYKCAFRSTQTAFQCFGVFLMPIMFAVVFSLIFKNMTGNIGDSLNGVDPAEAERIAATLKMFFTLMPYTTLAIMLPVTANGAMTSFSREGIAVESLKILPISVKRLVAAKILAWEVFAVPCAAVTAVIVSVFDFAIGNLILSIGAYVLMSAVLVAFGVLWDLIRPKLKWTDPMQAIKHNTHSTIGQFIGMGATLAIVFINVIMMAVNVEAEILYIVCWSLIYAVAVIFAIADILIYRGIETYYNRIEI